MNDRPEVHPRQKGSPITGERDRGHFVGGFEHFDLASRHVVPKANRSIAALAVINVLPSCVTTAEFTRSSWASVDANRSRPDAMSHKCSTFGPPLAAMVRLSYENASAPARREET